MIAAIYARTLTGRRLLLAEIPQGELGLVDRAAEEMGVTMSGKLGRCGSVRRTL